VAVALTTAGSSLVLYPVTAILGALLSARRGWLRVVDALAVPALLATGSALRFAVSIAVARVRPPVADWLYPASGFAFPSGHTGNTTMAVGLLILAYRQTRPAGHRHILTSGAALLAAGAVGWSRVYLGLHWPSDVAGGWAFGVLWVALLALLGLGRPPTATEGGLAVEPAGGRCGFGCMPTVIGNATAVARPSLTPAARPTTSARTRRGTARHVTGGAHPRPGN
jgi:hypothetical protein